MKLKYNGKEKIFLTVLQKVVEPGDTLEADPRQAKKLLGRGDFAKVGAKKEAD